MHTLVEAAELLRSPFAVEDLAAAMPVVVDVPADFDAWSSDDLDELAAVLDMVSTVTVGVLSAPVPTKALDLVDTFDVLLATTDDFGHAVVVVDDIDAAVASIAAATAANPHSSVALVQLLRQRAFVSVERGLVLESLTYSMLQSGPEFASWLADRGPATLPDDTEPVVVAERRGTALDLVLNRPARANAFSASMRDALVEQLRVAWADPAIEGVLLRGAGDSFSSGGDLAEFGSLPDPATAHRTRLTRSPAWWVHRQARDVRVHLHGACIGAGIEVPAFAGTVIAQPDTRIRLPEVAMGLVPGAGGTVSLPRRIGPHRTAYLALTGAELAADDALAWGIVDRIG